MGTMISDHGNSWVSSFTRVIFGIKPSLFCQRRDFLRRLRGGHTGTENRASYKKCVTRMQVDVLGIPDNYPLGTLGKRERKSEIMANHTV